MIFYIPFGNGGWLLRTKDGKREASARMWLLIFILPATFFLAAIWLAFVELSFQSRADVTEGEVMRLYEHESWDPWHGDAIFYSPVFRYRFSDGSYTQASLGEASPEFKFEIGSRHEILFDRTRKTDVKLNDMMFLWRLPLIIALFGLVALLPSLIATWFLLRWLRGGTTE